MKNVFSRESQWKQNVISCAMVKRVRVMVFNATFNNISAISWWPVLLVEEEGVPGKNQQPATMSLTNFIT